MQYKKDGVYRRAGAGVPNKFTLSLWQMSSSLNTRTAFQERDGNNKSKRRSRFPIAPTNLDGFRRRRPPPSPSAIRRYETEPSSGLLWHGVAAKWASGGMAPPRSRRLQLAPAAETTAAWQADKRRERGAVSRTSKVAGRLIECS